MVPARCATLLQSGLQYVIFLDCFKGQADPLCPHTPLPVWGDDI